MLIGARAIAACWPEFSHFREAWGKQLNVRFSNDYDYIVTLAEYTKFLSQYQNYILSTKEIAPNHFVVKTEDESGPVTWEFEIAVLGSSGEKYLEYLKSGGDYKNILISIYRSHRYMPINWRKHVITNLFLDGYPDILEEITKLRFKENEKIHGRLKTPSLNKGKTDFFNDKTIDIRVFEHDDIHKIMAHYESPLFERLKPDSDKVLCSKELWDKLSLDDKRKCVLEETYVIALERKIIPMLFLGKDLWTHEEAFLWALQRVCTNLCSGWFREFASHQALELVSIYNRDYVKKFLEAFNQNKICTLKTQTQ